VSAARGAARERKVAEEQRADGWLVKGTGDAHGCVDQIHAKAGEPVRAVQVKGSRRGPFADFGPAERLAFLAEADAAGLEPWLAWAPPDRKPTRWLRPDSWPSNI
jgi:Holliday junction resolvase